MTAYYNEHDKKAAAWLRELIRQGHIAPGEVDERSIEDVLPSDLAPFRQCHFFAGIGVWSYALRQAGWPDDRPVWTGSCPCQPFSAAGKGGGFDDERHLWPAWFWLISQCRPSVIFGEQVASRDGLTWLDLVASDLEGAQFTFGSADLCAAGVGAPHIRQRLYFVAQSTEQRRRGWRDGNQGWRGGEIQITGRVATGELANTERGAAERHGYSLGRTARGEQDQAQQRQRIWNDARNGVNLGELADTQGTKQSRHNAKERRFIRCSTTGGLAVSDSDNDWQDRSGSNRETQGLPNVNRARQPGSWELGRTSDLVRELANTEQTAIIAAENSKPSACNGFWRDAEWIYCRDDKWRAIKPGSFPLVTRTPRSVGYSSDLSFPTDEARVMRLRGYGNSIVAPLATEFIKAYMEVEQS